MCYFFSNLPLNAYHEVIEYSEASVIYVTPSCPWYGSPTNIVTQKSGC